MASSSTQSQQIAVTDLDLPQLSDVRRQLEEVRVLPASCLNCAHHHRVLVGTKPPHKLVYTAEAGAGEVQGLRRECR